MSTAFRLKTFPEIFANMVARARALLEDDIDLNIGSVFRTTFEVAALSDADQYIQISKLLGLTSLDDAKGDDLDAWAQKVGSDIFTELRRLPARTSISQITVSDGTFLRKAIFVADSATGATTFTVDDASAMPSSGAVTIDIGTAQSETVTYTRVGNVFTVISPTTGLATSHQLGSTVLLVSVRSVLSAPIIIGAVTVPLAAGTGAAWTATGSVVLDRGLSTEEKRAFTRVADTLTVAATTFAHIAGSSANQSTTAAGNRAISAGTTCFIPPTDSTKQVNFSNAFSGVLLDGDFTSDLISVESSDVGLQTRAGSGSISQFQGAGPFSGATVTNPIAATRGVDREGDDAYRQRIKDFIQSLTRATPLALTTLVSGLEDPTTGQVVAYAEIIEPVSPGASNLYITDGTASFSLTQVPLIGRDVVIRDAEAGDQRGKLGHYGPYGYATSGNVTPRLFKSVNRGVATSVGVNFLEDTTQAMTINAFATMWLKTDDDQFFQIASNTAIRFILTAGGAIPSSGSYSIYNLSVAPLVPVTDFAFNEATGDLELVVPLVVHDGLVAASDGAAVGVGAYTYTTGLGAYVQRVINGDPTAFDDFPGLRASGTKVVVKTPTVVSPSITFKVIPARGFSDAQVRPLVSTAVQISVNALGIGGNIILSELIKVVKELTSVEDVVAVDPTSNITITNSQIARISDSNFVMV